MSEAVGGPLANRDFRFLLGGSALAQMLGPLQFLTQILWVQQHAPEDTWLVLVAMIGACRGVGALTFGLYGGALADRFDRRKLLIAAQVLQLASTFGIGWMMLQGEAGVAAFVMFYTLALLSAGLQSVDMPTRLAVVPDLLGAESAPRGIALNQVAGQIAAPVAMFSAGFLIYWFDFGGAYLLSGLGHGLIILCMTMMHYRSTLSAVPRGQRYGFLQTLRDIRFGLQYARNHAVVLWVIVLLTAMMGLGFPATANLGPTWITKVVGVALRDVGYVVMTWGLGSLVAALAMTRMSSRVRRGRLVVFGALLFSASFLVFVGHDSVVNVVIGNLGLGAGMTITMVSSTVIIQQLVPNEVRGRLMSIFQLNIGFAQLMTMPVAALGQWLTLPVLFPILALVTLLVVALILLSQRQILRA